jgi:hypothetical protein
MCQLLNLGFHIRLSLQQVIRKAGKKPSKEDELEIAQRRMRLSSRITAHQTRARRLLSLTENEEDDTSFSYFDSGWTDDDDQDESFGTGPIMEVSGHEQPEKFNLSLPSTLGLQTCRKRNLQHAVDAEIQIRTGHCNDTLQAIRLFIVKKSILYKSEVRPAVNTYGKTRAYHKVQAADASLRCQAQIYRKSRAALKALKAPDVILDRFQELQAPDLQTTSTFLHPSVEGTKHKHLAWFWLLDVTGDAVDENVMMECELYLMI